MSTRHAVTSAFDMEWREPQIEELCGSQQQFFHDAASEPQPRTLPHTSRHRVIPPHCVHLRRSGYFLRLGELEFPRRCLLLLHRISHYRLRWLRPDELPDIEAKRKLEERIHTDDRVLCLSCFRTYTNSDGFQPRSRWSSRPMYSASSQLGHHAAMTIREERLQLNRQSFKDVMIVIVKSFSRSTLLGSLYFLIHIVSHVIIV